MRYPQGGGLTPERQAFRERIRLEAAERFAAGASNVEVAKDLRVSVRSVQRWRRAWHDAGTQGLRSAGPVSRPKVSEALFIVLEQELAKGPVAHGWPDQTWTLGRIKTPIGRRFHKSMTLSAIAKMLHRHGFSHEVPARRAVERDEAAVAGWVKETWPQMEGPWRRSTPGCACPQPSGQLAGLSRSHQAVDVLRRQPGRSAGARADRHLSMRGDGPWAPHRSHGERA
ncbi:hypothetical protein GCM10023323_75470 [Streptomyces thinghirensis]|uniref:Winged helix-turn helix domain-containing protein n=1 Tax=Streptomyces thinghirensis TaxID=551547 RepID=A0ABP9THP1_9ACTN